MENVNLIQQLYIAYYGRPADPEGLAYWAERLEQGEDAGAILAAFGISEEFTSRFGELGNETLVNTLYQQIFSRNADDVGLEFYTALLNDEVSSPIQLALDILNGAQGADRTAIEQKTIVADRFTTQVAERDLSYNAESIDAARQLLSEVTADTDVNEYNQADVETLLDALADPDDDAPSPGGGTTGPTDRNFSVDANALVPGGGEAAATITGGAGNDTLTVNIPETGSFLVNTLDFSNVTNIETLVLSRDAGFELRSGTTLSFDLSDTSFRSLVIDAPFDLAGTFTLLGGENLTRFEVNQPMGVDIPEVEGDQDEPAGTRGLIQLNGFANDVTIVANANISANFDVGIKVGLETLSFSGAGNVEAGSITGAGLAINAEALTGNLSLALNSTGNSVTAGAGDDVIDISALAPDLGPYTIEGGEGRDELIITEDFRISDLEPISGFEVLNIVNLAGNKSYAAYASEGYEALILTDATPGARVTNLDNTSNLTLVNTDDAADAVELEVADNSFSLAIEGAKGEDSEFVITAANVEDLTISTLGAEDAFQTTTLAVTPDALKTLTVTGNEAVNFAGTAHTTLESVDVSAITAASNANSEHYAAHITVGDGVTVTGSAGDDLFAFGSKSTVTGGEGNDTFNVTASAVGSSDIMAFATITDFNAGDLIDVGRNVTSITEIDEAEKSFDDLVTEAVVGDGSTGELSYFTFEENTYLVQDNTAGDGFSADDVIVQLEGVVDLSLGSFVEIA